MISKLLLAVQESIMRSDELGSPRTSELINSYYDIRAGIGFNKTPSNYGAFPTDPYSHTPKKSGAKQPGMTGQVKEEIITRLGELGISIIGGSIHINPRFLKKKELLQEKTDFTYIDHSGNKKSAAADPQTLIFTYCGVPFRIIQSQNDYLIVLKSNKSSREDKKRILTREESLSIFKREGIISEIQIGMKQEEFID